VCAAAGNLGHHPRHPILPPASAPSVLTVGGLDDKNRLSPWTFEMYHGSYGPTVDGLQKPEVLAPGIWVAAPILPGTPTAAQAILARLAAAPRAASLDPSRPGKRTSTPAHPSRRSCGSWSREDPTTT
jgi:serine protease AprX